MISQTPFGKSLTELGACVDAVKWVGDKTLAEAWRTCKRADWMLWLCGKHVGEDGWPTRQELVLAACDCAETVKHLWPEGDDRPAKAIKTARAWVRGEATLEKVRAAAYAADTAAYAAADAAYAAADAAYAAYAADTAADAYAAYAGADTRREIQLKMCAIIRKRLHPNGL